MAWYDRDYAREPSRRMPRASGRPRLLVGGSIVTTLIVVNIALYVLGVFDGARVLIYGLGAMQADAVLHGQVWRLFTAQYLHANTWHLFINMLVLHFLGRPLEDRWSTREFFFVYTMCGLAGNIFYTLLGWIEVIDPAMPAVGASGSIYGLLGIVAVLFPHATVYVYFLFPIKIRTAAFIFGGIAFLTVISRGVNYGGEACHLAGLVFGVWWAWMGEGWWQRNRHRFPRFFSGRSAKQGHYPGYLKPSNFADRIADRRIDQVEVDRILKKVYDHGLHSLTSAEREYLRDATERQREREAQTGRVDRL